jgi:hypothetical protein
MHTLALGESQGSDEECGGGADPMRWTSSKDGIFRLDLSRVKAISRLWYK